MGNFHARGLCLTVVAVCCAVVAANRKIIHRAGCRSRTRPRVDDPDSGLLRLTGIAIGAAVFAANQFFNVGAFCDTAKTSVGDVSGVSAGLARIRITVSVSPANRLIYIGTFCIGPGDLERCAWGLVSS